MRLSALAFALALVVSQRGAEAVCPGCGVDQYCELTAAATCTGTPATCPTANCKSCPPGTRSAANSLNSGSCQCIETDCKVTGCSLAAIWEPCEVTVAAQTSSDRDCSAVSTQGSCANGFPYVQGALKAGTSGATAEYATCCVCKAGTYASSGSNSGVSATCMTCPHTNSYSPQGSARISDCKCNAGFSGADGQACTACPTGNYKPLWGSGNCLQCPKGTVGNSAGASSCLACPAGTHSATVGSTKCSTCPADTYSLVNATVCIACPVGKVTNGMQGVTSSAGCVSPGGTWFDDIKANAILALLIICTIMLCCIMPTYVPIETNNARQAYFEPPVYERGSMVVPKIAPPPAQEVMMTEVVGQPQQYMSGPPRPTVATPALYASGPDYSMADYGGPPPQFDPRPQFDSRR